MQKKISVLIIYHVWLFEPKDGITRVKQLTRENDNIKKYCRDLLNNYKRELLAIDCEV